jgi:hypothetical protein
VDRSLLLKWVVRFLFVLTREQSFYAKNVCFPIAYVVLLLIGKVFASQKPLIGSYAAFMKDRPGFLMRPAGQVLAMVQHRVFS